MSARVFAAALALLAASARAGPFEFQEQDTSIPTHFVSVQTGVNFGLIEVSLQSGHFVAAVSGCPGWAVTTDARFAVVDVRAGYSWALSPPGDTMWFFDLTADVLPGHVDDGGPQTNQGVFAAFGVTLGFRYVHWSGLMLGFRAPLVGLAFGDWLNNQHSGLFDVGTSVIGWYLALAVSSSVFTVGLRF